jgi:signal transduction histidine kinase
MSLDSQPEFQTRPVTGENECEAGTMQEYAALLEILPVAVVIARDTACRTITGNRLAEKLFGAERGANLSKYGQDLQYRIYDSGQPVRPEDLPLQVAARTGRMLTEVELVVEFADGGSRNVLVNAGPLYDEDEEVCGAIAALLDVTDNVADRQRLEDLTENLESRARILAGKFVEQSRQLRALALQLTRAEHAERLRIARILHDRFQQMLVGAKFKLGLLCDRLEDAEAEQLGRRVEEIIDESLNATRNLAVELSTPILYDGGLSSAVRWLAERMAGNHGLQVDQDCRLEDGSLDVELRVLCFDCIQELLLNVIKHAGVDRAELRVWLREDDEVCIAVTDRGAGFDMTRLNSPVPAGSGFGLFHLSQRVQAVGGSLEIDSAPGRGTQVRVCTPRSRPLEPGSRSRRPPDIDFIEPGPRRAAQSILLVGGAGWQRAGLSRLLRDLPSVSVVAQQADLNRARRTARTIQPDLVLALASVASQADQAVAALDEQARSGRLLVVHSDPAGWDSPEGVDALGPDCSGQELIERLGQIARRQGRKQGPNATAR